MQMKATVVKYVPVKLKQFYHIDAKQMSKSNEKTVYITVVLARYANRNIVFVFC